MRAVMLPIHPKWCEKIARGKKTVEVRKNRPKIETPFKCYIYCTLPPQSELFTHGGITEYANELIRLQSGEIVYDYGMRLCINPESRPYTTDNFLCRKVIGEFVCERIDEYKYVEAEDPGEHFYPILTVDGEKTGLEYGDIEKYGNGKPVYFWHISDLVIYDKPKELRAFHAPFYDRCYASMSNALCDESCIFRYSCLKLKRPPQSWCYVEELK